MTRDGATAGPSVAARAGQALLVVLVALLATLAATGWLYLLRHARGLGAGPALAGALPLQRLAGGDAQPLLRFAVAWVPTGLAAGIALRRLAPAVPAIARAGLAGVTGLAALLAAGAVSDAITSNETVRMHAAAQAGHGASWIAAAVLAAAAYLAGGGL